MKKFQLYVSNEIGLKIQTVYVQNIGKIRKSDEIKRELGYVLRATAKRAGGGEQGAVIEANIPDPCAWDNGNPDCEVNVPSGDIPGFVDASSSPDDENMKLLNRAAFEVKKILLNPAFECREFFGAFGYSTFQKMISGATTKASESSSLGIRMRVSRPVLHNTETPPVGSTFITGDVWYGSASPTLFEINTNGPFVVKNGKRVTGMGNYLSGSLKIQVLQLLHELGHLTITDFNKDGLHPELVKRGFVRGGVFLLKIDGDDPSLSVKNTNKVLDRCKDEIDAIEE